MTKIMIVDDDIETTTILESILKLEGFEPTSVNDSTLAIEKAELVHPDMFLLDLMMPEMGGKEFLKRLRSQTAGRKVPVLVFTAFDNDEREVELLDLGATDFISKTSSAQVMLARIRKHLSAVS